MRASNGNIDKGLLREQLEWLLEQPRCPESEGLINLCEWLLDISGPTIVKSAWTEVSLMSSMRTLTAKLKLVKRFLKKFC